MENLDAEVEGMKEHSEPSKEESIEVWEVRLFGSWIILYSLDDVASTIASDLSDIEPNSPEPIIVTKKIMLKSELEKLPEFEGH